MGGGQVLVYGEVCGLGSFIRGKRGIDRLVCIAAGGERGSYLKCTAVQLPGRAWVAGRVEGGVCRKRL